MAAKFKGSKQWHPPLQLVVGLQDPLVSCHVFIPSLPCLRLCNLANLY